MVKGLATFWYSNLLLSFSKLKEAARTGNPATLKTLLEHGADINARTNTQGVGAGGGSVLWWALQYHEEDSEVVQLLKESGAKIFGPGDRHDRYEL